jgi:hypothetical protein
MVAPMVGENSIGIRLAWPGRSFQAAIRRSASATIGRAIWSRALNVKMAGMLVMSGKYVALSPLNMRLAVADFALRAVRSQFNAAKADAHSHEIPATDKFQQLRIVRFASPCIREIRIDHNKKLVLVW